MTARRGSRMLRGLIAAAAVATLGVAGASGATGAVQPSTFDLTILGTSDTHGNVRNWDYFRDAEFDDSKHNDVGLAKAATLVNQIRGQRGKGHTIVLDAGDTIQGTPLAYYYAKQEPITTTGETHPMARAMNLIHYDAVTIGNHEFNYGLPMLQTWAGQLDFPALAANAVDATTGQPAFKPYFIKTLPVDSGRPVRVGILGLTNPGVAIWDKANVEGRLRFDGMVETAQKWVPVMKAKGADVVVVSAHGGDSGLSSYGPELPVENAAALVAQKVAGVDAVLFGHAHNDVPQKFVTNELTGEKVLLSEPSKWGQRLTDMQLHLVRSGDSWRVESSKATTHNTNTVDEDRTIVDAVADQHAKTVAYVNQVVATSTEELSAAESRYKDTPILDYINKVQTDTVSTALAGGPYGTLPVLSIAAPFSRTAVFPKGDVKIKDVAGLYIYDNTLEAVVMTGAEVRAYLEYSAKYFKTFGVDDPVDPAAIEDPAVPDYNYDTLSGVDYDIDISKPVGQRITSLTYAGTTTPVADDQQFVVAVNNYRRSGGGNFPGITKPQIYNEQKEIRQLLIDWAQARGVIDPKDFYDANWRLVREGKPVF
ncbi:MAG TPA: 5'-nucleotidase C-terminal domain-containing protein [Actinomycetes bacterium]